MLQGGVRVGLCEPVLYGESSNADITTPIRARRRLGLEGIDDES